MTDDQLRITIDLSPNLDAFRRAVADMFAPRLDRIAARAALGALLDGDDDDHAVRLLGNLDADQLYAIEAAASGLAIHASRLRGPLVEAERAAAVDQADELAPWYPGHDLGTADDGERADPDMKAAWLRERDRAEQAETDLTQARRDLADYGRRLREAEEQRDAHAHLIAHWADEHIVLKTVSGPDVHASWCYRCRLDRAEAARDAADTRARSAIEQRDHYREAADQCRTAYRDELAKRREVADLRDASVRQRDEARAALDNAETRVHTAVERAHADDIDLNAMTAFEFTAFIARAIRGTDADLA